MPGKVCASGATSRPTIALRFFEEAGGHWSLPHGEHRCRADQCILALLPREWKYFSMGLDQTTTAGMPPQHVMQQQQNIQMDSGNLAGREFELPAITENNVRLLETTMPLMLANVMGREEFSRQASEINREFSMTGADAIAVARRIQYASVSFLVIFLVLMVGGTIASIFTFGLAMIPVMIIWLVLMVFYVILIFYYAHAAKKARAKQIQLDRAFLADVSDTWASRGIAWRLREGAPVAVAASRYGRIIHHIPMLVYLEIAPNAAQLFQQQGPFQASVFERSNEVAIELNAVTPTPGYSAEEPTNAYETVHVQADSDNTL